QAPTWEKDRMSGIRVLLRAIAEGKVDAPEQILSRWTWRPARPSRKVQDRRARGATPEAQRTLAPPAHPRGTPREGTDAQRADGEAGGGRVRCGQEASSQAQAEAGRGERRGATDSCIGAGRSSRAARGTGRPVTNPPAS